MTGDDRREQAITFTSDDPVVLDKLIRGELEEGSLSGKAHWRRLRTSAPQGGDPGIRTAMDLYCR